MPQLLPSAWRLDGRIDRYTLLRASDLAVEDADRAVSPSAAAWLVSGWLHDPSLRDEVLGLLDELGASIGFRRAPTSSEEIAWLSRQLTTALEDGTLVVLEDPKPKGDGGLKLDPLPSPPPGPTPTPVVKTDDWVAVRVVTDRGRPLAGERYRLTLPDGSVRQGALDNDGRVDVRHLQSGPCDIVLPDIDAREWGVAEGPSDAGSMYSVRQGEHLVAISMRRGFRSSMTVWGHTNNAKIAAQRDPNVLFPGDSLFIPDKLSGVALRATGAEHRFVVKTDQLDLHLVIHDENDNPMASLTCDILDPEDERSTDDDGNISVTNLPANRLSGVLTFNHRTIDLSRRGEDPPDASDDQMLFSGETEVLRTFDVHIGQLDPVDAVSGIQARLNNLGYDAGDVGFADEDPQGLRSAIEEFEFEHGLTPAGDPGNETMQAKLRAIHGC